MAPSDEFSIINRSGIRSANALDKCEANDNCAREWPPKLIKSDSAVNVTFSSNFSIYLNAFDMAFSVTVFGATSGRMGSCC